jgi:branched-chain amino acid transport system substrate-binding protein
VFQAYTPASHYLTGAADLLAQLDPAAKKIAIVHENDKFSTDVSNALQAYAKDKGFDVVLFEGYDTGTTDFAPFINKIASAAPDAIMGGGHFADTSTLAKQLYEKNVNAKFVALLVAPPEPKFIDIGDGAQGVIGRANGSRWRILARRAGRRAEWRPDRGRIRQGTWPPITRNLVSQRGRFVAA